MRRAPACLKTLREREKERKLVLMSEDLKLQDDKKTVSLVAEER